MSTRSTPSWPTALLVALAFLVLVHLTMPANLTEMDDSMEFARSIEAESYSSLVDARYLFLLPMMKLVWSAVNWVMPVRGYQVMSAVSEVFASAALAVFLMLLARVFAVKASALNVTLTLGFSYVFMRFSTVPEVYAVAVFLVILAYYVALSVKMLPEPGVLRAAMAGAFAVLPVLLYKPAAPEVAILLALVFFSRQRGSFRLAFAGTATVVLVGGYLTAIAITSEPMAWWEFIVTPKGDVHFFVKLSSFPKALLAIVSDIVSFNWVFGFDAIVEWVRRIFPDKNIVEEVFAANHAGWMAYAPFVTLPILAAAVGGLALGARGTPRPRLTPELWALVAWLVLHSFVIFTLDPGAAEPYLMVLPPLFVLWAVFVVERARGRSARLASTALVAALLAHNVLAGLGIYFSTEGDYYAVLSRPVVAASRPGDVFLTSNRKFTNYLRYTTALQVVDLEYADSVSDDTLEKMRASGHQVFICDDVPQVPRAVAERRPQQAEKIRRFWERIRDRAVPFASTPAGVVYRLGPPARRASEGDRGGSEAGR